MVTPAELVRACAKRKVKVLAITDHDTIAGYKEARVAGKKYGVNVICGEEVQSSLPRGLHVIGLFLKKAVPHSKPLDWTIETIQEQGGLAVVAHPLSRVGPIPWPTGAFQMWDLRKLVKRTKVDGIEIQYPSLWKSDEKRLEDFYEKNKTKLGAKIGASDSHFGSADLFSFMTSFSGKGAKDLYEAIKERKTGIVVAEKRSVGFKMGILQKKKALVDLGYSRYNEMAKRWMRFDFRNFEENL